MEVVCPTGPMTPVAVEAVPVHRTRYALLVLNVFLSVSRCNDAENNRDVLVICLYMVVKQLEKISY